MTLGNMNWMYTENSTKLSDSSLDIKAKALFVYRYKKMWYEYQWDISPSKHRYKSPMAIISMIQVTISKKVKN